MVVTDYIEKYIPSGLLQDNSLALLQVCQPGSHELEQFKASAGAKCLWALMVDYCKWVAIDDGCGRYLNVRRMQPLGTACESITHLSNSPLFVMKRVEAVQRRGFGSFSFLFGSYGGRTGKNRRRRYGSYLYLMLGIMILKTLYIAFRQYTRTEKLSRTQRDI